jgi:hypothetical protein
LGIGLNGTIDSLDEACAGILKNSHIKALTHLLNTIRDRKSSGFLGHNFVCLEKGDG